MFGFTLDLIKTTACIFLVILLGYCDDCHKQVRLSIPVPHDCPHLWHLHFIKAVDTRPFTPLSIYMGRCPLLLALCFSISQLVDTKIPNEYRT